MLPPIEVKATTAIMTIAMTPTRAGRTMLDKPTVLILTLQERQRLDAK
jgi:hypothetical protein